MWGRFALGSLLAALAGIALVAPSAALAAPSNCEYCIDLPQGDGGGEEPTASSSGGGDADQPETTAPDTTEATTTTPTTTVPTTDDSGDTDEAGGAGGGKGGDGGGGAGKDPAANGGSRGNEINPAVDAEAAASTDSGGISPLLIIVAIVAATCVGLAIWRLRRDNVGGSPAEINPGA